MALDTPIDFWIRKDYIIKVVVHIWNEIGKILAIELGEGMIVFVPRYLKKNKRIYLNNT